MAVSWRITVFQKCLAETPNFIVFWGRAFWAKFSNFGTPKIKNRKFWLIAEKLVFGYFCCFLFLFFLFLVLFCCLSFGGGFKGQVRWPKGPPHLALNPPYFLGVFVFVFLVSLFLFLLFCFCFFEGLGPSEVAFGPPHLTLNPHKSSCFFVIFFLFVFSFLCLLLIEKLFGPQKGHFCLFFRVSPSFSLVVFLTLFHFLFLCLSLLPFFRPSFFSFLFCFRLVPCYLSLSFFVLFLCFSFMKRTASTY